MQQSAEATWSPPEEDVSERTINAAENFLRLAREYQALRAVRRWLQPRKAPARGSAPKPKPKAPGHPPAVFSTLSCCAEHQHLKEWLVIAEKRICMGRAELFDAERSRADEVEQLSLEVRELGRKFQVAAEPKCKTWTPDSEMAEEAALLKHVKDCQEALRAEQHRSMEVQAEVQALQSKLEQLTVAHEQVRARLIQMVLDRFGARQNNNQEDVSSLLKELAQKCIYLQKVTSKLCPSAPSRPRSITGSSTLPPPLKEPLPADAEELLDVLNAWLFGFIGHLSSLPEHIRESKRRPSMCGSNVLSGGSSVGRSPAPAAPSPKASPSAQHRRVQGEARGAVTRRLSGGGEPKLPSPKPPNRLVSAEAASPKPVTRRVSGESPQRPVHSPLRTDRRVIGLATS